MALLDWMRRKARTDDPPPENDSPEPLGITRKGNPIDLIHSQDWQSEMGLRETRLHLGRSVEGFHGGFQDVPVGGDGAIRWSASQTDVEEGWRAAYGMYDKWVKENSQSFLDFENNAIRAFERKESQPGPAEAKTPVVAAEGEAPRTQSKYSGLYDHLPKTEAEAKRNDALFDMALVVEHIAKDPDPNWRKYNGDFEKAVSAMRESFGFGPQMRHESAEKSESAKPSDAKKQRESASPQQERSGWTWER